MSARMAQTDDGQTETAEENNNPDLTEAEIRHIADTLEAKAKDWEEQGFDGYAAREREMAARLRGTREEPVMGDY